MGLADALRHALADPTLRAALAQTAAELVRGEADYRRTHWGARGRGPQQWAIPDEPARFVALGALSRIGYVTTKGNEQAEFVHMFGVHGPDGLYHGPRPILAVGYHDDDTPPDLWILRGESKFTVTTHGIED